MIRPLAFSSNQTTSGYQSGASQQGSYSPLLINTIQSQSEKSTPKNSSIGSVSDVSPEGPPHPSGSVSDSFKARPTAGKAQIPRKKIPLSDNSSEGSVSDESV
jgi:hypothetical protein